MVKKGIIFGGIATVVIIAIIASASVSQTGNEALNLDMGQTHGTVSTAMGSPILGSASAPITIIEFGDYNYSGNSTKNNTFFYHKAVLL